MHFLDGEVGAARGGDARAGHDLGAECPEDDPEGGEPRGRPERVPAVAGRDPRQPEHRQRGDDQRCDDDHRGAGDRQVGDDTAERVAHRLDAEREEAPVVDRVERTVEGDVEADVEELHQHEHAERRTDHARDDAPHTVRQHDGEHDDDDSLERKLARMRRA